MLGCNQGFVVLLNAEVDSMGGAFDGETSIDTQISPRQAAIEKAQAELRFEYNVREQRRRELEFLEKGGNPLDFIFDPPTSTSLQSTSLADHLFENEAKGIFAEATSPHGDSVESSGRSGSHSIREPNIADNLLLFDDVHSAFTEEKNGVRSKRKKIVPLDQTAKCDLSHNTKDSEESSALRLSVRGQAYARRNRSKSTQENAHISTIELDTLATRIPVLSSSQLKSGRQIMSTIDVLQSEDHESTICKSMASAQNYVSKGLVSVNNVASNVERAEIQLPSKFHNHIAEAAETKAGISTSDSCQAVNEKDQFSLAGDEQSPTPAISGVLAKQKHTIENFHASQEHNVNKSGNEKIICHSSMDTLIHGSSGSEPSPIKVSITGDATSFQILSNAHVNINIPILKEQNCIDGDLVSCMVPAIENGDTNGAELCCDSKVESNSAPPHATNANTAQFLQLNGSYDFRPDTCDAAQFEISDGKAVNGEIISQNKTNIDGSLFKASVYESENVGCKQTIVPERVICSNHESLKVPFSKKATTDVQVSEGNDPKSIGKSCEDGILTEAQIIETKHKRAKEPPSYHFFLERERTCHWDYVLEEMAWLANDFMQERIWKVKLASQMCHIVSAAGYSILGKKGLDQIHKRVAQSLSESIKGFWNFAEKSKGLSDEDLVRDIQLPIQRYAIRLLQSNHLFTRPVLAEAPRTPERLADGGILEISLEDLKDESIFYEVPFGAMQVYRESVETYWLRHEFFFKNMDTIMHPVDCEASLGDSGTEVKNRGSALEDDLDDSVVYYLHKGFEGNLLSNSSPQKTKGLQKKFSTYRSQGGFDAPYISSLENKTVNRSSQGKRPCTTIANSIPTKRFRTATRQRLGSSGTIGTGAAQMTSKTDASSGDTNSFQEDESSFPDFLRKNAEVELTMDFEKQVSFDGAEVSTKPKKKKAKYLAYKTPLNSTDCVGSSSLGKGSFDSKRGLDPLTQLEQVDLSKRKLEAQQVESSGPAPYPQHVLKKPKILKQLPETSLEAVTPNTRPLPSPVASQMSNMSPSNRFIKAIQGRDKGKRIKPHKGASGLSGSGSAWSQFEDQALVVLVHDLGPNWELVTDAINNTLQFKCIFRKPKECKERHKVLMDRSAGDGADSAEDSGSSQHYPSTLPGIPKGSARQLFQRLQGPLEEDTIKSHFEKIIAIAQRLYPLRIQKESQELKQSNPVHVSHFQALSQACPNNLSGGPLTPLDLCDTISPNPDALLHGYQGSQTNGTTLPNQQGSLAPALPASSSSSLLQGSPGMVMGNSFQSPSGLTNAPIRDTARYSMPRSTSLPADDPQRAQYNPMLANRAISGAFSGGSERVRMISSGNGVGMMCGVNLGMTATRPGFQGMGSPGVLNMVSSSNMLSSNGVGVPGIHHNSTMRSRESLQPRTFPVQQQPSHQISPVHGNPQQGSQQPHMHGNPQHPHIHGTGYASQQQPNYAMHLANKRQQRLLQQQQQPFSSSAAVSSLQGTSQLQQPSQPSSPLPPISPSHSQHKQQPSTQNTQVSLPSQVMKQRQRQLLHQHQQSQHQAKPVKGAGRGGVLLHQNLPVDASYMNGSPSSAGNQILEKHMMQPRQVFYPGTSGISGSNLALPQASQQKIYRATPHPSKILPVNSQVDNTTQAQSQTPPEQSLVVSQPPTACLVSSQSQQQKQSTQPHQGVHRVVLQQNRQLSSESPMPSGIDLAQSSQIRTAATVSQSLESANVNPDMSSGSLSSHWKQERSFEVNAPATASSQLASSPSNLVGGMDTLMPSSGHGLMEKQFPGSFSVHGHGTSSPWPQQHQQLQSQQSAPSPLTHQQQYRHPVQGTLYGRPSPNP